jgi:hypothetical protein
MPPKKAKPKPLTQKAEKEMMGQEDIASTTKELDDAKARAVARMAKAREAKKAKAVAPSKENITLKITEPKTKLTKAQQNVGNIDAPFGYTATGRIRKKPTKERQKKIDKGQAKIAYTKSIEEKAKAPPALTEAEKIKRGGAKQLAETQAKVPTRKMYDYQKEAEVRKGEERVRANLLRKRIGKLPPELRGVIKDFTTYNFEDDDMAIDRLKDIWETLEYQTEILRFCFELLPQNYPIKPKIPKSLEKQADELTNKTYKIKSRLADALESVGLTTEGGGLEYYDVEGYEQLIRSLGFISEGDYYRFRKDWSEETLDELEEGLEKIETEIAENLSLNKPSKVKIGGKGLYEDDGMNSSDDDEEGGIDGNGLEGGALSAKELKGLLGASYDPKIDKVGDFILDSKLSTKTSKVYHNPNSGQTVVAHKGTEGILDWGNNAVYALGGKTAYKMTPRYKEAEKVQKKAESKYGAKNVSTIGHSQGGLQAELLGGKSKEIITLNKATRPFESNTNKNQYDVRSGRDVVSALNPFEKKSSKNVEIQGETYNPLAEHSGDVLDRLDENQMIGEGLRRMIEGEGTEAQRFIANMLRSRFNPQELSPPLLAEARRSLATLYPNIKGTVYDMENIQGALNALTHSADATGYRPDNPYMDYEERPTFISRPRLYGKPTIPPDILVDVALKSYFDMVYNLHRKGFLTGTKQKGQWVFGD